MLCGTIRDRGTGRRRDSWRIINDVNYLITGANTGIGLATARALADRGETVFLACRSPSRGSAAAASIGARYLPLDLASLSSVRACAASFLALVASEAHYAPRGIDWAALRRPPRSLTGMREYAVSKLCNVLFTQELARRYPAIHSYALHPGVVASDIWRRVPWPVRPLMKRRMIPNDEGAATSVYCATSSDVAADSGLYYDKCAQRAASSVATPVLGAELWERSSAWVGP
jgi:NAD(P)-dependent dehydrogenase (short-subunit alcohol dehydrogenase family)